MFLSQTILIHYFIFLKVKQTLELYPQGNLLIFSIDMYKP